MRRRSPDYGRRESWSSWTLGFESDRDVVIVRGVFGQLLTAFGWRSGDELVVEAAFGAGVVAHPGGVAGEDQSEKVVRILGEYGIGFGPRQCLITGYGADAAHIVVLVEI